MTLRLIYSRPIAYVADDKPRRTTNAAALLRRLVQRVLEALHRSRARSAARELRRYRHLIDKGSDCDVR